MLRLVVAVHTVALTATTRWSDHLSARDRAEERGQATAEYALVLLGAVAVALLLLAWATKTDRVGKLLNAVVDKVISQVT